MPQTVFLRARSSISEFAPRSSKLSITTFATSGSRRSAQSSTRTPVLGLPKPSRLSSIETASPTGSTGTPFEDLKRRLATINGSTSPLTTAHGPSLLHSPREPKNILSPIPSPGSPLASATSTIPSPPPSVVSAVIPYPFTAPPGSMVDRPGSPTESVVSGTNSTSFRTLSRLQLGGGAIMDSAKAAPAVGSSKTNAVGLLDAHSKLSKDQEGSPERSGRSSPASVATTSRPYRSRHTPLQPISTYGKP